MSDNTKLIEDLRTGGTEDRAEITDRQDAAADALEAAQRRIAEVERERDEARAVIAGGPRVTAEHYLKLVNARIRIEKLEAERDRWEDAFNAQTVRRAKAEMERDALTVRLAGVDVYDVELFRSEKAALAAAVSKAQHVGTELRTVKADVLNALEPYAEMAGRSLREHDERTYAFIAGQFSSDVEHDGAEVIGRIRSIQHSLEPHAEPGPCIICDNDPEGI